MLDYGHLFEGLAIGTIGLVILMPNIARMWYFTIIKPKVNAPFTKFVKSMGELFIHMFTQKRAFGCDDNKLRWFEHFILVIGYLSLLFTMIVLNWFGTSNLFIIILGYVMSAIVFVVWLFLMGFTAFMVRLFIDLDILEMNKWMYLFHLTVLVQWALIIVPFGKWTHFLYRSFAMYFAKLKA